MTLTQLDNLIDPKRTIEGVAVNKHDRTAHAGIRVGKVNVIDANAIHCTVVRQEDLHVHFEISGKSCLKVPPRSTRHNRNQFRQLDGLRQIDLKTRRQRTLPILFFRVRRDRHRRNVIRRAILQRSNLPD